MVNINLLPWRTTQLQNKAKQFRYILGIIFLGVMTNMVIAHYWLSMQLKTLVIQEKQMIEKIEQIKQENQGNDAIAQQQKYIAEQLAKIQILQKSKQQPLLILNYFSKQLSDQIYIVQLKLTRNNLTLVGFARSHQAVLLLLKNLKAASLFRQSDIRQITINNKTAYPIKFVLSLVIQP